MWRIPKDGTARSDARPDVHWADSLDSRQWLAWDGENILGPVTIQNYIVQARVQVAGSSPPEYLKLHGAIATRRGDEILRFQTLRTPDAQTTTFRLLVASSKGAPAGSVVACGPEGTLIRESEPMGIAADDNAIYVSYSDGGDMVIARGAVASDADANVSPRCGERE